MMYTCKLVFICFICWCHGSIVFIQDKSAEKCPTNVNVRNGTSTKDDRQWAIHLKMPENLEIMVAKQETPEKREDYGYYNFHTTWTTWFGAKQICEQEGAHLLVLNSEREFTTIKGVWDTYPKLYSGGNNDFIHVGLHDLYEEGNFITIEGVSVNDTGYTKWGPNEPNNGIPANCLALNRDGRYYDSYCNNMFAYFCEK